MSLIPVDPIDQLLTEVTASAKYRQIAPDLVRWVGARELEHHNHLKDAVKATRSKLHQAAGSYQEGGIAYDRCLDELKITSQAFPKGIDPVEISKTSELRNSLRGILASHASTRERLPILETFYQQTLDRAAPVHSILDLACGLNPLTAAWMPLAPDAEYYAVDIYQDMVHFLNLAFPILGINGRAELVNLLERVPEQHFQVALLLKALPCLEQLDKTASTRLLDRVQADVLLVSYPVHSLGGRSKGMPANYEARFRELTRDRPWQIERFEFATELVFVVTK